MPYDFPPNLVEASRACRVLDAQIAAFPLRAVTLADGRELERRGETAVYDDARDQELAALCRERLDAATAVVTHGFWASVDAGDRWAARSALHEVARG